MQAARAARRGAQIARDLNGREMLTAYAAVAKPSGFLPFVDRLGWLVFVELPAEELTAPAQ
jgi:hypothetical protein